MNSFIKEIHQQADALEDTLNFYCSPTGGGELLARVKNFLNKEKIHHVIYSGMGSSYYNSLIADYYLNSHKISCDVRDTGELLAYYGVPKNEKENKELFIGVSQSGESGELVKLIKKWQDLDLNSKFCWGITNNVQSTLGQEASLVFPTIAGEELSVTSKTYITGILVHLILARTIVGNDPISKVFQEEIRFLITIVREFLAKSTEKYHSSAYSIDKFLGDFNFLNFIGQGCSMATAMQSSLNLKEVSKVYSEALTIGIFRHGPIEIITQDYRAIFIINDQYAASIMKPIITNVTDKWGGGKVIILTNQSDIVQDLKNDNILTIFNPIKNQYLAPIYDIVVIQQYLCLLAEKRGFIPGDFRNSQKITK
jgi:glutamine---fructose-6-phosphate transaminase (isomerizing)